MRVFLAPLAVALVFLMNAALGCPSQPSPSGASAARAPLTDWLFTHAVVLDVRTQNDHGADGHVRGDHNIPVGDLEARLADVTALVGGDKSTSIVVYCRSGRRSARAKAILEKAGFGAVVDAGGYEDVIAASPSLAQR
jgi:phage shock protein E